MTYSAYKGDAFAFNVGDVETEGDALQKAKKIDPEVTHVVLESEFDPDERVRRE